MELSFSELRAKEVVNTQDGKKLGKVCDVALCYPENKWLGIVVPNGRGFAFKKNELFIDLKHIVTIGEDVILVNIGLPCQEKYNGRCGYHPPNQPRPPYPQARQGGYDGARNYEEME